jgi:hypothetical protein
MSFATMRLPNSQVHPKRVLDRIDHNMLQDSGDIWKSMLLNVAAVDDRRIVAHH